MLIFILALIVYVGVGLHWFPAFLFLSLLAVAVGVYRFIRGNDRGEVW